MIIKKFGEYFGEYLHAKKNFIKSGGLFEDARKSTSSYTNNHIELTNKDLCDLVNDIESQIKVVYGK